jgi:hypothetical protein
MTRWNDFIPRSAFRILGNGPNTDLYSLYIDVMIELYEQILSNGKLLYDDARDQVEGVLVANGISELPQDSEFDDPVDAEIKIGYPAKVLRRLEKAGWLRRETDRQNGEDLIQFPRYTFRLLRTLIEIQEDQDIEYDAMLVSILRLLSQTEISRRKSIALANRQMLELLEGIQGLIQQFVSLRPDVEALDHKDLADWSERYSQSALKKAYDNLHLRNSPGRWSAEILESVRRLQNETQEIAEESLTTESRYSIEQPTPAMVNGIATQISSQLSFIERGIHELVGMQDTLDQRATDFTKIYTGRIHTALSSQIAENIMRKGDELFAALRKLPKSRGGGDVMLQSEISVMHRFGKVTQNAIVIKKWTVEPVQANSRTELEQGSEYRLTVETAATLKRATKAYMGPKRVEEHFSKIFGNRLSMTAEELIGKTIESGRMFIRLIDCCSLRERFGFEIDWPKQDDEFIAIPTTANLFVEVSNVTITKKNNNSHSGTISEARA